MARSVPLSRAASLQGSWGWGGGHPAVSAALPLPEEMPGLLERVRGAGRLHQASVDVCQGDRGKHQQLKSRGIATTAEGCTLLHSPTHPLCLEEPPWLHSAEPLPGIASPGSGHIGSTQRQVSSPSLPSPASSPGSQAAGSGSC